MKGRDFLNKSFVIIFATLFFGDLPGSFNNFLLYAAGEDSLLESKKEKLIRRPKKQIILPLSEESVMVIISSQDFRILSALSTEESESIVMILSIVGHLSLLMS